MTIVETSEGYVYTIPETLPAKPVVAAAVVSGETQLHTFDGDGQHLVLHGNLSGSDKYIVCESTTAELFRVDNTGKIKCPDIETANYVSVEQGLDDFDLQITANTNGVFTNTGNITTNTGNITANTGNITTNTPLIQTNISHIAENTAYSQENETDISAINTILGDAVASTHTAAANNLVLRPSDTTHFAVINRLESELFRALGTTPNISLYGQGAVNFVPLDASGQQIPDCEYAFGKKLDLLGDTTGAGDGLFMSKDDNDIQIEVRKAAPTIRITGEKNTDVDYLQIIDESDEIVYAIDKTGKVRHGHHLIDAVGDIPDTESHSGVFESASLYIGPVRISYDQASGILKQQVLNRIPLVLQNAPYNITNSDLSGRTYDDLSARQWIVLARNKIDDVTIQARDIFTSAADWDDHNVHHAQNLTSDAQTQLNAITTDVTDLETLTTNINSDVTTLETEMDSAETRLTTIESDFAPKADPVFSGNMELVNDVGDATIKLERTGHTAHYLKSHSDDFVCLGVDNGPNIGIKAKFNDTGNVNFYGNLELVNASADCQISLERTGYSTHYIKSHSDSYMMLGVDGGGNNGVKAKFFDNKNVEFYGHVNIPTNYEYRINGTALAQGDVGLGNVNNTADSAKPVSTAQQTALDLKANLAGGPTFSAGMTLTKTVQGTALEWSSHQQLITVTIDDVRSGSIPVFSSFNMSGVQRFFLEVTSNQISSQSVVVVHTWSPNGYENWLPQCSNLRTRYNSGGNTFRITVAVSGTHSMSGNTTTNLFMNYVIL